MLRHFQMFADYNRWANARVYDACAQLSDADLLAGRYAVLRRGRRTVGAVDLGPDNV